MSVEHCRVEVVGRCGEQSGERLALPFFLEAVQAGFPSPADDYVDKRLDLNEHLIRHPAATYFVRAQGDSMIEAGIYPGDILLVDRALQPCHGDVVVAAINGELTVKRLHERGGNCLLVPENQAYPSFEITPDTDLEIWGVVTYAVHKLDRKSAFVGQKRTSQLYFQAQGL